MGLAGRQARVVLAAALGLAMTAMTAGLAASASAAPATVPYVSLAPEP
jgi:hypothetical protein